MNRRNQILRLDNSELAALCTMEFFKGSGPGGQKRNKSSSAVRVFLPEFSISAEDCTERSQHRNRDNALKKLKITLALKIRVHPAAVPERMECGVNAPDYPLWTAQIFDLLEESSYDYRITAQKCSISASALLKKLFRDPIVWQYFSQQRTERGLPQLHP